MSWSSGNICDVITTIALETKPVPSMLSPSLGLPVPLSVCPSLPLPFHPSLCLSLSLFGTIDLGRSQDSYESQISTMFSLQ